MFAPAVAAHSQASLHACDLHRERPSTREASPDLRMGDGIRVRSIPPVSVWGWGQISRLGLCSCGGNEQLHALSGSLILYL